MNELVNLWPAYSMFTHCIIHMNTQENLRYGPVVFVDILDKRDSLHRCVR